MQTINNTQRVFVLAEIKRMSYAENTAAVVVLTQQDGVFVAHELLTLSLTASYTHVAPNVRPLKCSLSHSCNFLQLKPSVGSAFSGVHVSPSAAECLSTDTVMMHGEHL